MLFCIRIKEIFGDTKRTVELEDLAKMKYSEAVLCETLRMFPPIPIVGRLADHDLQLSELIKLFNSVQFNILTIILIYDYSKTLTLYYLREKDDVSERRRGLGWGNQQRI